MRPFRSTDIMGSYFPGCLGLRIRILFVHEICDIFHRQWLHAIDSYYNILLRYPNILNPLVKASSMSTFIDA